MSEKPRLVVIGDIMVDVDVECSCDRICQEGPWPVLKILSQEERPGGAGNVAQMCVALGAECLLLGNSADMSRKTRFFVGGKLTGPRIDRDSKWIPDAGFLERMTDAIQRFRPQSIIVADHGKGVVSDSMMKLLYELDYPVFVDPVTTTPFCGSVECIVAGEHEMGDRMKFACLVTKLGPNGLRWYMPSSRGQFASHCHNCIDPLGAGDQLIATLAIRRVLGDSWKDAIETANIASGLQCERQGCVPVTSKELEAALHRIKYSL